MKAWASPPCRGTRAPELASSCPRSYANCWHSQGPNPALPRPMPDTTLGHLLSQRLEIKRQTVTCVPEKLPPLERYGSCHGCRPPQARVHLGTSHCSPTCWCLASLSPSASQDPPLIILHLQGARIESFSEEAGEGEGHTGPTALRQAGDNPGKGLYPEAMSHSVPQGTRPWTWLSPCK